MDAVHKPAYIVTMVISWVAFVAYACLTFLKLRDLSQYITVEKENEVSTVLPPVVHQTTRGSVEWRSKETENCTPTANESNQSGVCSLEKLGSSVMWMFIVVVLVYVWQIIWLSYGLSTLCKKTSYGYLYIAPGYMHPSVYWCFTGSCVCGIATLVLVEFNKNFIALWTIVAAMLFVYISLMMSMRRVYLRAPVLIRELKEPEVWMSRAFVHNGLGALATMLTYMALFHFAEVLTQDFGVFREMSVTIAVNIIFLEVLIWFFLDTVTLDKFSRYTISPYLISILINMSILTDSEFSSFNTSNSVMVSFILVSNAVGFILKIVIVIYKHIKRPLFTDVGFSARKKNYGTLDYSRMQQENKTLL